MKESPKPFNDEDNVGFTEAMFGLTRSVQALPALPIVRHAITIMDRSPGGYIARQQRAQLLGYLLLDQREGESAEILGRIPGVGIDEDQRQLIWSVHQALVHLADECLKPLALEQPEAAEAVRPYNRFDYTPPELSESRFSLPAEQFDAVVAEFEEHAALRVAREVLALLNLSLSSEELQTLVDQFVHRLEVVGPHNIPNELEDLISQVGKSHARRIFVRLIGALACIRTSVENCLQLVYQAVRLNRLVVLNEDNVFSIDKRNRHSVSCSLTVQYLYDKRAGHLEPKDIVLVKLNGGLGTDGLCRVDRAEWHFSADTGDLGRVSLRELDDHLNPFGNLPTAI